MGFSVLDEVFDDDLPHYSSDEEMEDVKKSHSDDRKTEKDVLKNEPPAETPVTSQSRSSPRQSFQKESTSPSPRNSQGRERHNSNSYRDGPRYNEPRPSTTYHDHPSPRHSQKNYQNNDRPRSGYSRSRYDSHEQRHRTSESRSSSNYKQERGHSRESGSRDYNPLEKLQVSSEQNRNRPLSSSRGDFPRRRSDADNAPIRVEKPPMYKKRTIKILGQSPSAPEKVTQPILEKINPLKDWRNFTLETDSETFAKLSRDVSAFLHGDNDRGRGSRRDSVQRGSDRGQGRQDWNDRPAPRGYGSNSKPPMKLEFYLIYADEGKVRGAISRKRWEMPLGPIQKQLNDAYNEADLVLVFFSRQIIGCARVASAIGFQGNETLPGCTLHDIREAAISVDTLPNFTKDDLVDGKKLSDSLGKYICDTAGLSLHSNGNGDVNRSRSYPEKRRSSRDRSPVRGGGYRGHERSRLTRPNDYWRDHDRPADMRNVDEGIVRSRVEAAKNRR